jgi:UDP:flavonoid glycosyltransferase YjiC (YdhE family)
MARIERVLPTRGTVRYMRALICSGGGTGNVHPLVPFARALGELGVRVAWAVAPGQQATVRDLGFEGFAVGPSAGVEQLASRERGADMHQIDQATLARIVIDGFASLAEASVPRLAAVVKQFQPDVLLRDATAYAAWIVGEQMNVPVALFDFGGVPPAIAARVAGPRLNQLREAFGLPADPDLAGIYRWLVLVGAPPGWTAAGKLGPTAHLVQPPDFDCAEIRNPPAWLDTLCDHQPVVYATLGTVFGNSPGVWQAIFEAAALEPEVTFVATVGDLPDEYAPLTGNVRVERYIPHSYVLDIASAVIAHGGYGTTMGALRHGLPIVFLPMQAADNILNATRTAAQGAGIVIPQAGQTAPAIRDALRRVLSEPTFRNAAGQVASQIAQQPSPGQAAQLILRLARTRQPIVRTSPLAP